MHVSLKLVEEIKLECEYYFTQACNKALVHEEKFETRMWMRYFVIHVVLGSYVQLLVFYSQDESEQLSTLA